MKKLPIFLVSILFLFTLVSCSHQSAKKRNNLTHEVAPMSEEEINRRALLEKYRRLREEDWENYRKRQQQLAKRKTISQSNGQSQKITATPKPQRPLEEIQMEAEQLLSYHCLKHRLELEDCQILTETANYSCQEGDPQDMIPCLKKFLTTQKN